jgi:hypothetical protein
MVPLPHYFNHYNYDGVFPKYSDVGQGLRLLRHPQQNSHRLAQFRPYPTGPCISSDQTGDDLFLPPFAYPKERGLSLGPARYEENPKANKNPLGSATGQLRMVFIALFRDHALLTTPNRLFGFGNNIYLQLGFSSPEKYHPELVPIMMEEPLFIAAGFRQSYCIVNNSLRGCGESKKNELGKASKKLLNW